MKLFEREELFKLYLKLFPLKFIRYHNYRVREFIKSISVSYDKKGKKLIDIGSEETPYRKYFKNLQYFTSDIKQNRNNSIDYVEDINIGMKGIENEQFDYIICTQVFEHIKKPNKAFEEFFRILKPGGLLFLTTHLIFEEHMQPNDYFRYTRYGLKYLGESVGFSLIHIHPHGGIFHVIALIFDTLLIKLFIKRYNFLYYLYFLLFTVPILCFNILCYYLDFLDKDKIMTLNYECIYQKPHK